MKLSESLTVILSQDAADLIKRKVQSGAYHSASEVIEDSLRAMQDSDAGLEQWLHDEVLAGHAEYLADPSKAIPAEEVLDRIKARRSRTAQ